MNIPVGAETRFAEALQTGQYQPLPRLRDLRKEAREMAEEQRAAAAGSSKDDKKQQQQQPAGKKAASGSSGGESGGKGGAAERTFATPKGPAPQSKKGKGVGA